MLPSNPEPRTQDHRRANSGNGIRTRVPALRGLCPSPLDDTAACSLLDLSTAYSITRFTRFHNPTGPEGIEPPTAGFGDQCSTN